MNKELLKGSTETLILSLLSRKPMYGYGLIKELEVMSNGIFKLKEGTLYPILHSLENKKLVESYWEEREGQRKRKYYRITDNGKKELSDKKKEWQIFSNTIDKVLGGNIDG
ncbi:PadR family transcriptional regulator [Caloranaerobacter azorensis]|uniref:PadR family transcriptional regulator n=1 Tax=Caloranaerobacter azorensis TaxID=116090 RepID=A0A6P1YBZ2_9FIRM|nr:PadR family transcriptional regulator [Caloranaerobacter azorensis]QIB26614.1 PadR family transcriptional regulator [Caloranaerobacter azorensis]